MASLTIRNLDESVKRALRERAASNGRSMEEEMRILLTQLRDIGNTALSDIQTSQLRELLSPAHASTSQLMNRAAKHNLRVREGLNRSAISPASTTAPGGA